MEKKIHALILALDTKFPLPILFLIPLLILFALSRYRAKHYPPGPRGWPVIGNMGIMGQLTHVGLAHLAKRYGSIFLLRLGSLHMIVVSSPDTAREVLQAHDSIFSNRPATAAIRYLTYDRADMAFVHYGPFWRQMRKLCVMKLFSRKRAESWASDRDEVDVMVRAVAEAAGSGRPVNVGELVFGLTWDVIYRAAFGSGSKEGPEEFIKILQEFSKLFGAFNVADFIPWLGWVDLQGLNGRLVRARDSLDRFIDTIIEEHMRKEKPDGPVDSDMVDELLAFYSDDQGKVSESEDLKSSIKLTRNNIKAIIMV
ncbi:Cytochrome P450 84A1 [Striga hermonthica]|uniref:Cytochrome P450 84A1 n=1 Tax=Striga hermonthica TaxID=68872 RepID=A0A9N7NQ40_STRHE|nr:Cytochrome P450 84A1 [Striga hermonthica]